MKKCIKLIFAAAVVLSLAAERAEAQDTVAQIAADVCKELGKVDLDDSSTPAIARAMDVVKGLIPRIEHGKVIENYKKENPDAAALVGEQLEDRIVTDIACLLMRDCPKFLAIAMNGGKPMPAISKTVEKIGGRFNRLLDQKLRSAPMSQKLVGECTTEVVRENQNELVKVYGAEYMAAFQTDFRSWLLSRCEPYMRWTVGNMIGQFRMLQNFGI